MLLGQIMIPQTNPTEGEDKIDWSFVNSFESKLTHYKYERNNVEVDFSMALKPERDLKKKSNFIDTFRSVYYQHLKNTDNYFYYMTTNMTVMFLHQAKKENSTNENEVENKKFQSKVILMAQHKNFTRTLQKNGLNMMKNNYHY